ncbi:NADPH:quinone reductase-like Zn-dependent oxidoreductase [Kribbella voronezhensis]|uniref:NADPH:quinone reductase-like Zn-dependent oxidoreductase n=1 Tax=Kribbella voronezhensis TaxID=2512212 RepID=A0A4R7T9P7_9ACTN|nr:zinc-binding dehydrogenase [Kribbella voronezhensis]TDU87958.1 NADPH:quinone reductase-like Zn-dependent oxidoreductase [Kribbella voronezhensis]
MRAIAIREFGDPSGMALVDVPEPVPGAGQVVIATEAIGVGGVDAVIRRGTLGAGFARGMIPGSEVAGTITAVGDDVDRVWIGRRVWAFTGTEGGYAEQALAYLEDVTPLPEGLTSISAVTLGSAAAVAHFALAHAHFVAGESVLVRGAAGSIGIATVELAARGGAAVVAVTTSAADRGRQLERLGATHVLDRAGYGGQGAPELYDVVIDIVGGDALPTFIDRLAPNGRLILVGAVAGFPPADFGMRLLQTFQQSRSVATFSLATTAPATRAAVRADLFEAAVRGELHPVVHQTMPLDHAAEAHDLMDRGTVFGRIVLTP